MRYIRNILDNQPGIGLARDSVVKTGYEEKYRLVRCQEMANVATLTGPVSIVYNIEQIESMMYK